MHEYKTGFWKREKKALELIDWMSPSTVVVAYEANRLGFCDGRDFEAVDAS